MYLRVPCVCMFCVTLAEKRLIPCHRWSLLTFLFTTILPYGYDFIVRIFLKMAKIRYGYLDVYLQ